MAQYKYAIRYVNFTTESSTTYIEVKRTPTTGYNIVNTQTPSLTVNCTAPSRTSTDYSYNTTNTERWYFSYTFNGWVKGASNPPCGTSGRIQNEDSVIMEATLTGKVNNFSAGYSKTIHYSYQRYVSVTLINTHTSGIVHRYGTQGSGWLSTSTSFPVTLSVSSYTCPGYTVTSDETIEYKKITIYNFSGWGSSSSTSTITVYASGTESAPNNVEVYSQFTKGTVTEYHKYSGYLVLKNGLTGTEITLNKQQSDWTTGSYENISFDVTDCDQGDVITYPSGKTANPRIKRTNSFSKWGGSETISGSKYITCAATGTNKNPSKHSSAAEWNTSDEQQYNYYYSIHYRVLGTTEDLAVTSTSSGYTSLTTGYWILKSDITLPSSISGQYKKAKQYAVSGEAEQTDLQFKIKNTALDRDNEGICIVYIKPKMSLFYWHSESTDKSYFEEGKPISTALTHTNWNNFLKTIKNLYKEQTGNEWVIGEVNKNTKLTANNVISGGKLIYTGFNGARNQIALLNGQKNLPSTVNKGDPILGTLYQDLGENNANLKTALNSAINYYNNN